MRKKVLIISEERDQSTNSVIDWLEYNNIEWVRFNIETSIDSLTIEMRDKVDVKISNREEEIILNNDHNYTIWYRRGAFAINSSRLFKNDFLEEKKLRHLEKEWKTVLFFLDHVFKKNINLIGSYTQERLDNKLIDLFIAKEAGFDIPITCITNSKEELIGLSKEYELITKSLDSDLDINTEEEHYGGTGTNRLDVECIQSLPNLFFPSLVQAEIKRIYELRIFFIEETFFAMAIFNTSSDIKETVDYRNVEKKNIRYVPYEIPTDLREKLLKFITLKNINTGSIDVLVSKQKVYYFLELNPAGQFGWLSYHCNYSINKEIAKVLAN